MQKCEIKKMILKKHSLKDCATLEGYVPIQKQVLIVNGGRSNFQPTVMLAGRVSGLTHGSQSGLRYALAKIGSQKPFINLIEERHASTKLMLGRSKGVVDGKL